MEPDKEEYWLNLGNLHHQRGAYDKAQVIYEAIVEKNPQSADAYYQLGLIYQKLGETEKTMVSLEKGNALIDL